jgi:hypothetical protein
MPLQSRPRITCRDGIGIGFPPSAPACELAPGSHRRFGSGQARIALRHRPGGWHESRIKMWSIVASLFAALAIPACVAAKDSSSPNHHRHHHYRLIDIGSFGGPASSFNYENDALNSPGVAVGASETPIPNSPQSKARHENQASLIADKGRMPQTIAALPAEGEECS